MTLTKPLLELSNPQWRQLTMLRARGTPWEKIAAKMNLPADELERLSIESRGEWKRWLLLAQEVVDEEILCEAVHALRAGLRSDDDRMRIQAANALARMHACRHPQPKPDKADIPKPMTEREAQFYREADFFANMSEAEYKFRKAQAQRHSFIQILSTICQDRMDVFNQVLDVADMNAMGHPRYHEGQPLPSEKDEEGIYGIFSGKIRKPHDRPMRFPDGSLDPAVIPTPVPKRDADVPPKPPAPTNTRNSPTVPTVLLALMLSLFGSTALASDTSPTPESPRAPVSRLPVAPPQDRAAPAHTAPATHAPALGHRPPSGWG
jgi:hypothetical protein